MIFQIVYMFCCVCELCCGFVGIVEDGELVQFVFDKEYFISQGFCCYKGFVVFDVYKDVDCFDELFWCMVLGDFEVVLWEVVFIEIGECLQMIFDELGGDVVLLYIGNLLVFNVFVWLLVLGFF